MASKVGTLIKEARTAAKLTQDQLSQMIDGLSAADISKAERGEKELTQSQLKSIAKITGVTQSSLLNAAKETTTTSKSSTKTTASKSTAAKSTTAKTTAAKSTSTKSTAAKTTAKSTTAKTTAAKTTAKSTTTKTTAATTSEKLTATEKKFVEAYRAAGSDVRKAALRVLKGECNDMMTKLLGGGSADSVADFIGDALGKLLGG